jgi:hypothetical protein
MPLKNRFYAVLRNFRIIFEKYIIFYKSISYICKIDFDKKVKVFDDFRKVRCEMKYKIAVFIFLFTSCINTKDVDIKTGVYVTHKPGFFKVNYENYINNNYISSNDTLKIFKDNKYEVNLRFVISYGTYKIKSDSLILYSDSTFWVASNEMTYEKDKYSSYETFIIKNDETIIRNGTFRFCHDNSYENKEIYEFKFVKPF